MLSRVGSRVASSLNIAALAQRTGVQPDTLRKWEHRYGVICPERTAGGQRRYSDVDVARVEWLKARLGEGYRIGEAAALLGSAEVEVEAVPQTVDQLRDALYARVAAGDAPALERLVAQTLGILSVEVALGGVLVPVLERVGSGWAEGELTVAQEHLGSAVIRAHLERLLADARGSARGVAVLACAPGERHELGLLMLAIMMRADGWQVAYLGSDTPVADASALAAQLDARLLCISASLDDRLGPLGEQLAAADMPQETALVLGGAAMSSKVARSLGGRYVADDLCEIVGALRA
jgi:MerR family transcriptional regulator, light-induced transcriptional regulator